MQPVARKVGVEIAELGAGADHEAERCGGGQNGGMKQKFMLLVSMTSPCQ